VMDSHLDAVFRARVNNRTLNAGDKSPNWGERNLLHMIKDSFH
jgi:hypothetical protein